MSSEAAPVVDFRAGMLLELVDRSVMFWRYGMYAMAAVCWMAYRSNATVRAHIDEIQDAVTRADWLKAADILQYKVRPLLV